MRGYRVGVRKVLSLFPRHAGNPVWALALILCIGLRSGIAQCAEVSVAVASNFASPLESLGALFEKKTGHRLLISAGATGKLVAQIRNGAPFDIFLSADRNGPTGLVKDGLAIRESQFTFAKGRLVLWSTLPSAPPPFIHSTSAIESKPDPTKNLSPESARFGLAVRSATPQQLSILLRDSQAKHLALANPKVAPYGAAAKELMEGLGVWETLLPKLVFGENITQAYQFVATGNAELGLVALSQVQSKAHARRGTLWLIPSTQHAPLEQDAVLLNSGKAKSAARDFLEFLKSTEASKLIESTGYEVGAAQ